MEHLRNVGSAVLGWVVMGLLVFGLMSLLWQVLGPERAFQPESWEVTGAWIVLTILLGVIAAVVGGHVCARVAADGRGVWMLVVLVVVLGVALALPEVPEVTGIRPVNVSMMEAMSQARQPTWLTWLNPVYGALGVLAGARMARRG